MTNTIIENIEKLHLKKEQLQFEVATPSMYPPASSKAKNEINQNYAAQFSRLSRPIALYISFECIWEFIAVWRKWQRKIIFGHRPHSVL